MVSQQAAHVASKVWCCAVILEGRHETVTKLLTNFCRFSLVFFVQATRSVINGSLASPAVHRNFHNFFLCASALSSHFFIL